MLDCIVLASCGFSGIFSVHSRTHSTHADEVNRSWSSSASSESPRTLSRSHVFTSALTSFPELGWRYYEQWPSAYKHTQHTNGHTTQMQCLHWKYHRRVRGVARSEKDRRDYEEEKRTRRRTSFYRHWPLSYVRWATACRRATRNAVTSGTSCCSSGTVRVLDAVASAIRLRHTDYATTYPVSPTSFTTTKDRVSFFFAEQYFFHLMLVTKFTLDFRNAIDWICCNCSCECIRFIFSFLVNLHGQCPKIRKQ